MDDRLGAVAGRRRARVLELATVLLRECNRRMSGLFFDIELEMLIATSLNLLTGTTMPVSKRRRAVRFAHKRSPK